MAATKQGDRMLYPIEIPKYPPNVAKMVVKQVNFHLKGMVGNSISIQESHRMNIKFGIFDRQELTLGECLGSGSFAEVYEVLSFNPTSFGNRIFSSHQVAAREIFQRNSIGNDGKSRYVIKHVKAELMKEFSLFCVSACDLALEAHYLTRLNHQNVLKIHGWSYEGTNSFSTGRHDGYFLILERLDETLEDRIERWRKKRIVRDIENGTLKGKKIEELLARIDVAHGVASAVKYLHNKNIVFRDLKPDNIGFDENGVVKLFDFGLARQLPKEVSSTNELFEMSGRIGTARYMAPEILLEDQYNQKVDTYSWAMLFWTCLALELPYDSMSRSDHERLVCEQGQRPELYTDRWPESVCQLLENSWAQISGERFSMTQVKSCLEDIEQELKLSRKRRNQCNQ